MLLTLRKILEPMIEPTTSVTASNGPSTRGRTSPAGDGAVPLVGDFISSLCEVTSYGLEFCDMAEGSRMPSKKSNAG